MPKKKAHHGSKRKKKNWLAVFFVLAAMAIGLPLAYKYTFPSTSHVASTQQIAMVYGPSAAEVRFMRNTTCATGDSFGQVAYKCQAATTVFDYKYPRDIGVSSACMTMQQGLSYADRWCSSGSISPTAAISPPYYPPSPTPTPYRPTPTPTQSVAERCSMSTTSMIIGKGSTGTVIASYTVGSGNKWAPGYRAIDGSLNSVGSSNQRALIGGGQSGLTAAPSSAARITGPQVGNVGFKFYVDNVPEVQTGGKYTFSNLVLIQEGTGRTLNCSGTFTINVNTL